MIDVVTLRGEAVDLAVTADRCRVLADDIDRRRRLLIDRVEPVIIQHRPDVWDSNAADRSRELLSRHGATDLWFLSTDLAEVVYRLRGESEALAGRSARLVAAAEELEASPIARSGPETPDIIAGDALDTPLGAALPAADPR